MPNLTLSVPDETKKRMDAHPEMRWSGAVRAIIEQRLDAFEEADRLAKKGGLKPRDFEAVSRRMEDASRKKALALLHESHR